MVLVLTVAVGGGLVLWGWVSGPFTTGLRLVGDEVRSGGRQLRAVARRRRRRIQPGAQRGASVGTVMVAVGSDTTSPVPSPLFLVSPDGGETWRLASVTGPGATGRARPRWAGWRAATAAGWPRATRPSAPTRPVDQRRRLSWNAVDPGRLDAFAAGDKIMDLARTSSGFVAVGTTVLPRRHDRSRRLGLARRAVLGPGEDRDGRPAGQGPRVLKAVVAKGDAVVALADPAQGAVHLGHPAVLRRRQDLAADRGARPERRLPAGRAGRGRRRVRARPDPAAQRQG